MPEAVLIRKVALLTFTRRYPKDVGKAPFTPSTSSGDDSSIDPTHPLEKNDHSHHMSNATIMIIAIIPASKLPGYLVVWRSYSKWRLAIWFGVISKEERSNTRCTRCKRSFQDSESNPNPNPTLGIDDFPDHLTTLTPLKKLTIYWLYVSLYACIFVYIWILLCYVTRQFGCRNDDYDHFSGVWHMMTMIILLKRMRCYVAS